MKKNTFLTLLLFLLFSLPAFLTAGCGGQAPSDFSPALTAAAASRTATPASTAIIVTPDLAATGAVPAQTPSSASTPSASPTVGVGCQAESTRNGVNMRRTPSGDIIGCCLALGELVEVLEVNEAGTWARIRGIKVPAHQGWVFAGFLKVSGECKTVAEE